MKKMITSLLIAIFCAMGTTAQDDIPNEINYYQTLFGMEKQAIVELFMSLDDPVKTEKFWDIYENYEYKRKELGQKRLSLLIEYVTNYKTLTGTQTDDLIVKIEQQKKSMDRIIYKFYKRIRAKVGSKEAGQFYQIENLLLNSIRADVLEHMPFIGEFD